MVIFANLIGFIMILLLMKLVLIIASFAIIIAIVSFTILFVFFKLKRLKEYLIPKPKYQLPRSFETFMSQIIHNPEGHRLVDELTEK